MIKIIRSLILLKYGRLVSKGFKGDRKKYKSEYVARGRGNKAEDFERMFKKINITIHNIMK
jgi:hypothetical protein